METVIRRRWVGSGWTWYATDGEHRWDGYARTKLGAWLAVWRLTRRGRSR